MGQRVSEEVSSAEQVVLEIRGDIALIRLGEAHERLVILTQKRLASLDRALEEVKQNSAIHGLVLIGATHQLFCAGADIHAIQGIKDPQVGFELASRGQQIFEKLASLSCVTIAAISGACVGGGCELVLACQYRILANLPDTRIGLPEIKLGILPGFGGTQRLPRLIGLRQALDIILSGKVVSADKALRLGLADKLIEPAASREETFEQLESFACQVAAQKANLRHRKPSVSDRALTYTHIGHALIQSRAKRDILKSTHGFYPAPLRALAVTLNGLKHGEEKGYLEEATALGELIVTKESKALVHMYFLTEASSKLGKAVKGDLHGVHAAVLGGGTMGAGIAGALLLNGLKVTLVDPIEEARIRARTHIEEGLQKRKSLAEAQRQELLQRLKLTDQFADLFDVGVVIEAVPEKLELKQEILGRIAEIVGEKAIIATNTSSLSIEEVSTRVKKRDRVIGMHFFNPAEKMPLVEVVLGKETNERTIAYTSALTVRLGKYPIVVNEVPGFLVNRILAPYLAEAAHALNDGYSISDVDNAATAFGMPMGPVRLLDEIGLDVAAHVQQILGKAYGARMSGPPYIEKLVSLNRLGRKTRNGFYHFEGNEAQIDPLVPSLLGLPTSKTLTELNITELTERMIFAMLNEAVRCLDEGVAGIPGKEAAGQVDLGSVMGLGFPPFRGGILYYGESLGSGAVHEKLKTFQQKFGSRFTAAGGIVTRSEKKLSFYDKV